MIQIDIPGFKKLQLEHLVLDYNGTLACDGRLIPEVGERLSSLASDIQIHVVTADTFGEAGSELEGVPCELTILGTDDQALVKLEYIRRLGAAGVVSIGNGCNDRLMLKEANLGIAVVQAEGAAVETLLEADVVCHDIIAALDLLKNPLRLAATLRL